MWLCVKFCGLPKFNFLICLMHFGEWRKKRLKKFVKVVFEKFGFVKHLKLWTYISYHKNRFSNGSVEVFFRIFKNFYFFRIWPIKPIFWPIEKGRGKFSFQLKFSCFLDSFLIPFDQSSLFSCTFQFLPDSSWPIGFQIFKTYRN